MKLLLSLVLLFFLAAASTAATIAPQYRVTDLGTLGGDASAAYGINDKGQVVGWASTNAAGAEPTIHAFLWTDGKMQDLDTVPNLENPPGTEAHAVNNRGEVAGGIAPRMGLSDAKGWLWRNGKLQIIGSDVLAVNDAGQALAVIDNRHTIIWRSGRTSELPSVPGFRFTVASALNNRGDLAGYCENDSNDIRGFVRLHGSVFLMGALPGQNNSRAVAVNDHGQVIGMSRNEFYSREQTAAGVITTTSGTHSSRAFFWQNGQMTDLGDREVSALGSQGQVLGSYFQYGPERTTVTLKAFLWQDGRFTDLDTLIDANSGWKLEDATAINNKGQIAGMGVYNGKERAFLLTPDSQPMKR